MSITNAKGGFPSGAFQLGPPVSDISTNKAFKGLIKAMGNDTIRVRFTGSSKKARVLMVLKSHGGMNDRNLGSVVFFRERGEESRRVSTVGGSKSLLSSETGVELRKTVVISGIVDVIVEVWPEGFSVSCSFSL